MKHRDSMYWDTKRVEIAPTPSHFRAQYAPESANGDVVTLTVTGVSIGFVGMLSYAATIGGAVLLPHSALFAKIAAVLQ
jgi:hypothetical protein